MLVVELYTSLLLFISAALLHCIAVHVMSARDFRVNLPPKLDWSSRNISPKVISQSITNKQNIHDMIHICNRSISTLFIPYVVVSCLLWLRLKSYTELKPWMSTQHFHSSLHCTASEVDLYSDKIVKIWGWAIHAQRLKWLRRWGHSATQVNGVLVKFWNEDRKSTRLNHKHINHFRGRLKLPVYRFAHMHTRH